MYGCRNALKKSGQCKNGAKRRELVLIVVAMPLRSRDSARRIKATTVFRSRIRRNALKKSGQCKSTSATLDISRIQKVK